MFVRIYQYDLYAGRLEKLKQEVKKLFSSTKGSYDRLKLIDSLQRLGVAYHFEQEIEEAITLLTKDVSTLKDLNETALYFRLLREHGHSISTGWLTYIQNLSLFFIFVILIFVDHAWYKLSRCVRKIQKRGWEVQ